MNPASLARILICACALLVALSSARADAPLRFLDDQVAAHPGQSGSYVLDTGDEALIARAWLTDHADRTLIVGRREHTRDQLADLVHLGFAHSARGHRGRADTDAAGHHRRVLIERNRVLVDGNTGLAKRRFRHLAGQSFREHVDQHQVVVGAAAHEPEPVAGNGCRQTLRVGDDLALILRE